MTPKAEAWLKKYYPTQRLCEWCGGRVPLVVRDGCAICGRLACMKHTMQNYCLECWAVGTPFRTAIAKHNAAIEKKSATWKKAALKTARKKGKK